MTLSLLHDFVCTSEDRALHGRGWGLGVRVENQYRNSNDMRLSAIGIQSCGLSALPAVRAYRLISRKQ